MFAKVVFFSSCATIFAGTSYVVGISMAPPPTYKVSNEQRINKFDEIAEEYETKTKKQEFYLGIGRWRRRILKEAQGRVLEVGAGSASNMGLYPAEQVDEVIFCDRSPHMIEVGARKIEGRLGYAPYRYPAYDVDTKRLTELEAAKESSADDAGKVAIRVRSGVDTALVAPPPTHHKDADAAQHKDAPACCRLREGVLPISDALSLSADKKRELDNRAKEAQIKKEIRLQQAAAAAKHTPIKQDVDSQLYSIACYPTEHLPFASNSFDTVVDMFGLCSFDDPVKALVEMSRVCKPDGKILLLEHGKGTWEKMNDYLDKWAPRHASMWGCWWNRDIRRYLRLSGVEVTQREEKHFGTTHYIVVRPFKSLAELRALEAAGKLPPIVKRTSATIAK